MPAEQSWRDTKFKLPCIVHRWVTVGGSKKTRYKRCEECGMFESEDWVRVR